MFKSSTSSNRKRKKKVLNAAWGSGLFQRPRRLGQVDTSTKPANNPGAAKPVPHRAWMILGSMDKPGDPRQLLIALCRLQIGVVQFQCALAAALALGEKVPSRFGTPAQLFVDRWWVLVYFIFISFLYFFIAFLLFYLIPFKYHPFSVGASPKVAWRCRLSIPSSASIIPVPPSKFHTPGSLSCQVPNVKCPYEPDRLW